MAVYDASTDTWSEDPVVTDPSFGGDWTPAPPMSGTIYPDGSGGFVNGDGIPVNADGNLITPSNPYSPPVDPNAPSEFTNWLNSKLGTSLTGKQLASLGLVGAGGAAGLLTNLNKPKITPVGYQGGIPQLQANRNMMTAPPAGRRPGSGGVNYGGDVVYSPQGTPADAPGGFYTPSAGDMAKTAGVAAGGLGGIDALLRGFPTGTPNLYDQNTYEGYAAANNADLARVANAPKSPFSDDVVHMPTMSKQDWLASRSGPVSNMARGGLMGMAHGGQYLEGNTDGMADKLRTSIDGKQPAALSHGEFVIPADVVSHLGNGNSDAGAKKLYSMMDKIREARTGTKKQGKQINPDKFMPGGLAAAYAAGGEVRHFATGDSVPAGTTGVNQTLASWTGDYVPNMLAQGRALANAPYQQYQGPLTAGASDLQNQAFNTASNLQVPGSVGAAANTAGNIANQAANINYTPTGFTNQFQAPTPYQNTNFTSGTFGNEQAQQYMNPYLQQSLNPQLEEARRQSQINQQLNNANAIKSGGFGGGAGDIMARASQRDLNSNLANITGQGYNTAYTNAMSQFNADQARNLQAQQASEQSKQFGAGQGMTAAQNAAQYGQAANTAAEQSKQFGANLGLQGLNTGLQAAQTQGNLGISGANLGLAQLQEQAQLGNTQRGIESEGIAADKAAFEQARDNPYKMLQFQQSLLNGLPISATNYTQAGTSDLANIAGGVSTVNGLLTTLGLNPEQTGAVPPAPKK